MLARIRGYRPNHATVAAYLALFVALGGTSYAAVTLANNSVKSKHIAKGNVKRSDIATNAVNSAKVAAGSLRSSDFAAGQIPPGPAGPAGPAGAKGDTGAPGPFPDVLPSGKTLTGVYSVTGVATGADQFFDSPIAFGFRFASAPSVVTVGISDTAEEAAAAGCPGTAADPQAAPGKVCIYEMGRQNTVSGGLGQEAGGADAQVTGYAPPGGDAGTATRFGTIVEVWSAAAGNLYSNGVWAATSP